MRVGVLAKGLVLTGDLSVQLVVMCAEKPTRSLLEKVMENLPKQLAVSIIYINRILFMVIKLRVYFNIT